MHVLKRKLTARATRSATVGIPSGRVRPSYLGMSTRRTGGGKYLPDARRFHSL